MVPIIFTPNSPVPAEYAVSVTPSDTVDLAQQSRALYIGTGGNLSVLVLDGSTVLFAGLNAGQILPVRIKRVLATGTTASSIVALY